LVQIIRVDGLGEVMIHAGRLGSAPILILVVKTLDALHLTSANAIRERRAINLFFFTHVLN
jgi:hypothetical protein